MATKAGPNFRAGDSNPFSVVELDGAYALGDQRLTATSTAENHLWGDVNGVLGGVMTGGNDTLIGAARAGEDSYWISRGYGPADVSGGGFIANVLVGDAGGLLEGAIGGNDSITGGRDASNALYGDAGAFLWDDALGGNDSLVGGAFTASFLGAGGMQQSARNTMFGDAQDLHDRATGGADRLVGGNGASNSMVGDGVLHDSSHGGNDTLIGGNAVAGGLNVNSMFGDGLTVADATNQNHAVGGNDSLVGGNSNGAAIEVNTMVGDGNMVFNAKGGNDVLRGGTGAVNFLFGDDLRLHDNAVGGNDRLYAGVGSTSLGADAWGVGGRSAMFGDGYALDGHAVAGNDTLVSAAHTDDVMYGDALEISANAMRGHNVFVFALGNGNDEIRDFVQGNDRIDLRAFGNPGLPYDVTHNALGLTITSEAGSSTIHFSGFNSIKVNNVAALVASDFLFA